MSEANGRSLREMLQDRGLVQAALKKGARDAVAAHAQAGRAVPEYRDGQIVWVQPDEILSEKNGAASQNGSIAPPPAAAHSTLIESNLNTP